MKRSPGATQTSRVILVLAILVLVNLLGLRFYHRWDLTENREFTLSPTTRGVLSRLDDVISVNVYFSKELPSYFATLQRQVRDLLAEYETRGGGKVRVRFKDPGADPALEQSVQRLGIPKLQLSRYQQERAEIMNAYLGIAVQFGDKTEVIPVVQSPDKLEYDLTAALVKVSTARQTVGVAVSAGPTPDASYQGVQEILRKQYDVRTVDLDQADVPPEVTTLVVVDRDELSDAALYRIDQFVMRGGRMLALAGGVDVNLGNLMARDRRPRMGGLLSAYGVDVESALVADGQAPMVSFDVGFFLPLTVRYPWFPQAAEKGLSRKNPITSEMQSLVLPWTSPLHVRPVEGAGGASVTADTLAVSSERSFAARAPYDLNPQSRIQPPAAGFAPQLLAVALSGTFPTAYPPGTPVPGDSTGAAARGPSVSAPGQIVVVGSASFLENRFLQQYAANAIFLANAVDWMTLGNDLIAIRSRGAASRPLKEVGDRQKTTLRLLAMVPVPLLVVAFGLVRSRLRRARRERYAIEFGRKS